MCRFKSGIAFENGDLFTSPHSDSHNDLADWLGLSTSELGQRKWVPVEFAPQDMEHAHHFGAYSFAVDGDRPVWATPQWEEIIVEKFQDLIRGRIITNNRSILLGGQWILAGTARVERLVNGRIEAMSGSSQVGEMCGSAQVGAMYNSAQVGEMSGSSQVRVMSDSSQVRVMSDSSQVVGMSGSSQVVCMSGSSQVGEMCGSSQVGAMYNSAQVGEMYDSSQVRVMSDSSQVVGMSGSSQVGEMYDSARAPRDPRSKKGHSDGR